MERHNPSGVLRKNLMVFAVECIFLHCPQLNAHDIELTVSDGSAIAKRAILGLMMSQRGGIWNMFMVSTSFVAI